MLVKIWSKGNTQSYLVEMQICITIMEIYVLVRGELGNQSIRSSSYSILGHIPKDGSSYHRDTWSIMLIICLSK